MERRAFIGTLAGSLLAAPLAVEAQQAEKRYCIGYLDDFPLTFGTPDFLARALQQRGWEQQRDYVFEARWADHKPERLVEFAAELVGSKVNVIVARGNQAATAASGATRDIPIVFNAVSDPVEAGLAGSLGRPGGNVTGVASGVGPAAAKQLELLHETLPPGLALVAVLWVGMTHPDASVWRQVQEVGHRLGITLRSTVVADQTSLQRALTGLSQTPPGAVLVYSDGPDEGYLTALGKFAIRKRVPIISNSAVLTWSGGLMSYARNLAEGWARTADYVIRLRNGARPADLPVQQPETFQLLLNRGTFKALGLTIPPSLLQRADQVIE
jgi:putative ABC transport system substrate-binding protein